MGSGVYKEFYYNLLDGRGHGWVYATHVDLFVNEAGHIFEAVFYRNELKILTIENAQKVFETKGDSGI